MCCPLIPLIEDGKGYPSDYQLPQRLRPVDSLDIPRVCASFRESLLYEDVCDKLDVGVVSVLSPYSLGVHVMVAELSPDRYCPGPEWFAPDEFARIASVSARVLDWIGLERGVRCVGYNWSPYAWGEVEERGGCQSVMTKFHMMVWHWEHVEMEACSDIPAAHQQIFELNEYNEPFARLVWRDCESMFRECGLFGPCSFGPRGLFVRIGEGVTAADVCRKHDFLRSLAVKLASLVRELTAVFTDLNLDDMASILAKTGQRMLTADELAILRAKPNTVGTRRSRDEATVRLVECLRKAVENRCGPGDESQPLWRKGFGYSLVLCDSRESNAIDPGLRILFQPICGPGCVAEALGCYLTRPEQRMADESVMIRHNSLLWSLSRALSNPH